MPTREGKVREVSEAELRRHLEAGQRDDRREDPRVPARLDIELSLTQEQLRRVYTSNISKGGLLFTLAPPAALPGTLTLTLTLPSGRRVTLESEVRHVAQRNGEFDVGVQFRDLDDQKRAALEEALRG